MARTLPQEGKITGEHSRILTSFRKSIKYDIIQVTKQKNSKTEK